ncbi:MAG: endonuclease/exonuclease/phosphatase family metal-dependent hydrolase [Parvicellaceae bacterium]|jgi:endonuclease/exonuclease/phosphatase family metal-dependent hydrolase
MKGKGYKALSTFNKIAFLLNILCVVGLLLSYLSTYVNPEKVNFMAFFGLIYPGFLLCNLFFLLYWLIKRKKQFLWSLVTIVIGITHLSHFIQLSILDGNDPERTNEVSVMSYNVRDFDLYEWIENKETRGKIFDFLKQEDPDIICFQEFYQDNKKVPTFVTRDSLLHFLSAKNITEGYSLTGYKGYGLFGNVTFSKYPIINQGHIKFENDKGNSFIFSDLLINNDTIRVYNAHIGSVGFELEDYQLLGTSGNHKEWPHVKSVKDSKMYHRLSIGYSKRVSQTNKLLEHAKTSRHPVVICGDFNDTPVSYNYRNLTAEYWDSFTLSGNGVSGTFTKVPFQRIDYILHDDSFNSFKFTTHQPELSDHRAISTTIEF